MISARTAGTRCDNKAHPRSWGPWRVETPQPRAKSLVDQITIHSCRTSLTQIRADFGFRLFKKSFCAHVSFYIRSLRLRAPTPSERASRFRFGVCGRFLLIHRKAVADDARPLIHTV